MNELETLVVRGLIVYELWDEDLGVLGVRVRD